jgi:hypothetical protein
MRGKKLSLSLTKVYIFVPTHTDNLPEVTEAIKPVLGEYYNYDSTVRLSLFLLSALLIITLGLSIIKACNIRPMEIFHTMHVRGKRRRYSVLQKSVWKRVDGAVVLYRLSSFLIWRNIGLCYILT